MIPDVEKFLRTGRCQEAMHLYDPVTMIAVASTAMQVMGTIQEGQAAKATADYNAEMATRNAKITEQQTTAAMETQDRERRIRRGQAIAGAGASGTGIESFGDILSSSAQQESMDLLTLQSEGLLRKRDFEAEASLQKTAGQNAMNSAILGAGSQLFAGGSKIFGGQTPSAPKETITWNTTRSGVPLPARKPTRY